MSRPNLVQIEVFKRLAGAQPGEVEGLLRSGSLKRAAPGKLDLIAATRALILHVKATAREASLTAAQETAKAARADASELRVAVERRELIGDDDAEAALQFVAGAVIAAFAAIPARTTRDLSARSVIEAAIRAAQDGLADELADLSGLSGAGAVSGPATRPKRPNSKVNRKGEKS